MFKGRHGDSDQVSISHATHLVTWGDARQWAKYAVEGTDLWWGHLDRDGPWPLVFYTPRKPEVVFVVGCRSGDGGGAHSPFWAMSWGRYRNGRDDLPFWRGRNIIVCQEAEMAGATQLYTLLASEGPFTGRDWTEHMKDALHRLVRLYGTDPVPESTP